MLSQKKLDENKNRQDSEEVAQADFDEQVKQVKFELGDGGIQEEPSVEEEDRPKSEPETSILSTVAQHHNYVAATTKEDEEQESSEDRIRSDYATR